MGIDARVLSARHRLLPEIGDRGVALLAASQVTLDASMPGDAASVAAAYLSRAGVTVLGAGASPSEGPVLAQLRGAHLALEHVARTVGLRERAPEIPIAPLLALVGTRDER